MYKVTMENGTELIVNAATEDEARELVWLEITGHRGVEAYGDIVSVRKIQCSVYCVKEVL